MIDTIRFKTGIAAAVLAAGVAVAGYASAQNTPAGPGPFRPDGPPMMRGRGGPMGRGGPAGLPLPRLNLTDAQRDQVQLIVQSHDQELKALAPRVRQAREALDAAIAAASFDEAAIRARAADLAQAEADLIVAQARLRAEIVQQVLTADQKTQLQQLESGRGGRGPKPGA
jgi:Spy/CpxP family protein refolding chaperone